MKIFCKLFGHNWVLDDWEMCVNHRYVWHCIRCQISKVGSSFARSLKSGE